MACEEDTTETKYGLFFSLSECDIQALTAETQPRFTKDLGCQFIYLFGVLYSANKPLSGDGVLYRYCTKLWERTGRNIDWKKMQYVHTLVVNREIGAHTIA